MKKSEVSAISWKLEENEITFNLLMSQSMKKQLLFFAIILLSVVSCKKDDDSTSPVYGKWTIISGGGAK
jgi:hypothetical protein